MPAVDQPSVEVDEREVDKDVVVPLSTMAWFHSCHASSFIKLYKTISLYNKRGITTMKYSYTKERGNSVPIRTKISPTKK